MQTLLQKAYNHLIQVDKRMQSLIEQHPCYPFSLEGLAEKVEPFEELVNSIISQQIAVPVARSIKARFVEFFNQYIQHKVFPSPLQVATASTTHLRQVGLSQRKVDYIKGLAEAFVREELSASILYHASFSELFEKLIVIPGLGKWSIEMFAVFGLKKIDIFSVDDLGIQRGMAVFFDQEHASSVKSRKWKYMAKEDMLRLSAKFAPYRSIFMWFMWRVASVKGSAAIVLT